MPYDLDILQQGYGEAFAKHARELEPLKNITDRITGLFNPDLDQAYKLFRNKPFYRFDLSREEHLDLARKTYCNCCFNHIVGLPIKPDTNKRYPMFEYEKIMFDEFNKTLRGESNQYYFLVVKSTGLGITEFVIRIMAWLATRNNDYRNQRFGIVTGLTMETANEIIERVYDLFDAFPDLPIEKKIGKIVINGVTIQAFPSENVKKMRSYKDFRFLFADEADFFEKNRQKETRTVLERYHTKSKPFVWLVSTPNNDSGICYQLMTTPEESRGYKLFEFNYEWGMEKHGAWIFTPEDIEEQKKKADFDREYDLKFSGKKGNLLNEYSIAKNIINTEYAKQIGYIPYYDLAGLINQTRLGHTQYPLTTMAIDPAFGTSKDSSFTGVLVAQRRAGRIELIYADELVQPDYQDFIEKIGLLIVKRNIRKIYVDGWWSFVIKDIKRQIGEYPHYDTYDKKELKDSINSAFGMRVCPVHFNVEGDEMTQRVVSFVDKGIFRFMKEQTKLYTALASAWAENNRYDKDQSSNDDLFDCVRLITKGLEIES